MSLEMNVDDEARLIDEELSQARESRTWHPPNGNYEVLFEKVSKGAREINGANVPWYKLFFKMVAVGDLERDVFTRYFSLEKRRKGGRGYALLEMQDICRALDGGKSNPDFKACLGILEAATASQDRIINVRVWREKDRDGATGPDGQVKEYARYAWNAAS